MYDLWTYTKHGPQVHGPPLWPRSMDPRWTTSFVPLWMNRATSAFLHSLSTIVLISLRMLQNVVLVMETTVFKMQVHVGRVSGVPALLRS